MRPPVAIGLLPETGFMSAIGLTVLKIHARICSMVRSGSTDRSKAATPATTGVAIDVPLMKS